MQNLLQTAVTAPTTLISQISELRPQLIADRTQKLSFPPDQLKKGQ